MTWSYDTSLATAKDQVRFQIGDTDTNSQLVSDEEIDATLTAQGDSVVRSSIAIAEALAAKFARLASTSIEGLSVDFRSVAENYRMLASRLRADASASAALAPRAFVGGISKSTMDGVDADTDRNPSRIKVGFTDYDTQHGLDENP